MPLIKTPDHEYLLDGEVLPSVTDILTHAGYIDKDRYDTFGKGGFYRERGQFIHAACDLVDAGEELDADSLTGYSGYIEGYRLARAAEPEQPIAVEQSLCHPVLRYAGTIDRRFSHKIRDIKTSKQAASWWRLQLGGYAVLVGAPFPDRDILQLSEAGSYRSIALTDDTYEADVWRFLCALTRYHESHKLSRKDLSALIAAANNTMFALRVQLNASAEKRRKEGQDSGVLAGRPKRKSTRRPASGNTGRPSDGDKGDATGRDPGDRSGRNERSGTGVVRQSGTRRRKVSASDPVCGGSAPEAGRGNSTEPAA